MDMFDSKAKNKITDFLRHIQVLGQSSSDRLVNGFQESEKQLIKKFTANTEDLIDQNEWGLGLENLLSNLYEIDFQLDKKAIDLAKGAIKECKMDYNKWAFIEGLAE